MTDIVFLQSNPVELLGVVFFFILVFVGIAIATSVRKTKTYRRELGDLYVAAKVKKIAKGEDLDLELEKVSFLDWNKKNKLKEGIQNYDDVVEEEMKEQVVDSLVTKPKK